MRFLVLILLLVAVVLLVTLVPPVATGDVCVTCNTNVSGAVYGVWDSTGSPYCVDSTVWVPSGSTLVIRPGVEVYFQGHHKFRVDSAATLRAVGTANDSIYFTTDSISIGWHGIRFYKASNACSLCYCQIEYGKATGTGQDANGGAIHCDHCSLTVSHNTIDNNSASGRGGGIYCYYANSAISYNIISDDSASQGGGGIACCYSSWNPRNITA